METKRQIKEKIRLQIALWNLLPKITSTVALTGTNRKNINTTGNIDILIKELCKHPRESGWIEFKHNNCEPNMIGEDISALANTATLNDRDYAYMIGACLGGSGDCSNFGRKFQYPIIPSASNKDYGCLRQ